MSIRSKLIAALLCLALPSAALADGVNNPSMPAGQLPGTATNDNACATCVGAFVSSNVVSGSAVAMTTATPANITSISLTAGDWDVQGACTTQPNGATTTSVEICSISTTSATLNTTVSDSSGFALSNAAQPAGGAVTLVTDNARLSLNATTTVYLVGQYTFATNVLSAYGKLRARRMR